MVKARKHLTADGLFGDIRKGMAKIQDHRPMNVAIALEDALMSAPDRAGSHLGWAMLCEGQQRYGEAIKAYERSNGRVFASA